MHVELQDSDGSIRVTVDADEAPVLAAALQRASYQDIPLELQQQTVVFAEDLLARVRQAIRDGER